MSSRIPSCLTIAASDILAQTLNTLPIPISDRSVILDSGCGDGTATTAVILEYCKARVIYPPTITAIDTSSAVIDGLEKRIAKDKSWSTVRAAVMDPHDLLLKTETLNLTICNFKIAELRSPLEALTEMHRSLESKGIAIVTCWKSGIPEAVDAAFEAVRGTRPGAQISEEGQLVKLMDEAGWERGKIKSFVKSTIIKQSELAELVDCLSSSFADARVGWSEQDNAKWTDAIRMAIEEQKTVGGLVLKAWVVLAKKWDQLAG